MSPFCPSTGLGFLPNMILALQIPLSLWKAVQERPRISRRQDWVFTLQSQNLFLGNSKCISLFREFSPMVASCCYCWTCRPPTRVPHPPPSPEGLFRGSKGVKAKATSLLLISEQGVCAYDASSVGLQKATFSVSRDSLGMEQIPS